MKNLKLLREQKGYTQINLQMYTSIDQALLSKYENDICMPTTENLMILAKYYNTSLDYIMDLTDVKEPYARKKEEN